jgi:hypothetical protein
VKGIHLDFCAPDLAQTIAFYEMLCGATPIMMKDDYANWVLDDPRVNFAISERGAAVGIDQIGIQADSADELQTLSGRLRRPVWRPPTSMAPRAATPRAPKAGFAIPPA